MKKFLCVIIFILGLVNISFGAEKATLVTQPAYHSMKFYVYKPVNTPNDIYVTYDGYLVYKAGNGVWHYGSAENNGIIRTGYVVGSVIPSVVRLKPYNAKISSVAPVLGTDKTETLTRTSSTPKSTVITYTPPDSSIIDNGRITSPNSNIVTYVPPSSRLEGYNTPSYSPLNTDWTQNSNFMAVGKWQKSIDRIGVLNRPHIPAAWKGDNPEVIYAWTGLQWKQINSRGSHVPAMSTLRRGAYDLASHVRKVNVISWTDDDTYVLSQYAAMWGYQWLGVIMLERSF